MIDAILFAVRDAIRSVGFGYSEATCDIMPGGEPDPAMGDWFASVHELASRSTNDNCLMEYFGFGVTLTRRISGVPYSRIGDRRLASNLARQQGPQGQPSLNARCEQLKNFLHMNWGVLQDANNNIVNWTPGDNIVYGFCEPARYRGMEVPVLQGGAWFQADPEIDPASQPIGLKAQLAFEDARRMQPIGTYT